MHYCNWSTIKSVMIYRSRCEY